MSIVPSPVRYCPRCSSSLPVSDFYARKTVPITYTGYCKVCTRAYQKEHRAKNPERVKQIRSAYYARTAEKQREYTKRSNQRLKETDPDRHRRENREGQRLYRLRHPEKHREERSNWRKRYPEKVKAQKHRRRAALKGGGSFTPEQWLSLCDHYAQKCLRCGEQKPLTVDHIIPIAQGGSNTIENIQPLCLVCNSIKGNRAIDYR